jgi:hypothetical protein
MRDDVPEDTPSERIKRLDEECKTLHSMLISESRRAEGFRRELAVYRAQLKAIRLMAQAANF